ncbi:MAG: endo alpha-1,4 polygalactosaminidase, partial [Candidatus Bipolaricaulota bacterium]|nr:endo alpha-1,4 polygalactosaminidase [Candidatus Bipolaricaulota bacterium]
MRAVLVGVLGLSVLAVFSFSSAQPVLWVPRPGTTWQIQFTGLPIDQSFDVQVYVVDLFDTDASVVASLKAQGRKVICYINAGAWEEWRPDADQFPPEVLGNPYEGWTGERWLDIRRIDLLAPIMRARLDLCRAKGFDGVDPDNIDGYQNNTGFPLTYQDQLNYNIWLANEAHARGLSIGLKNDPEQVLDLMPYFEWAIVESCFSQGWCEQMRPFIQANKAVFAIEYTDEGTTLEEFCPQANALRFSAILKNRQLDAWMQSCAQSTSWQRGISFAAWWRDQYSSPAADQALEELAATGATWISLIVTCYQEAVSSTEIQCLTDSRTPTDADLIHAIQKAKSLGLKVMLKPHVDLNNDPDHWRGDINFGDDEAAWAAWFASYENFIVHYAQLAQAHNVDQFCVGTELQGTTHRETQWRQIISAVRSVYSGPLVYAANPPNEYYTIQFWDALDFIGVDAYYPLTNTTNPTIADLIAGWQEPLAQLQALSQQWNKPVLFTEVGYRSVDGANITPWDWSSPGAVDLQEQADCYQALVSVVQGRPWLRGIFIWVWYTDPDQGGPNDTSYTPHNKPAEAILRCFFAGVCNTPALFRVERATGNVYADGAFLAGGADVAEYVLVSEA